MEELLALELQEIQEADFDLSLSIEPRKNKGHFPVAPFCSFLGKSLPKGRIYSR
jgi:hypothetical protein